MISLVSFPVLIQITNVLVILEHEHSIIKSLRICLKVIADGLIKLHTFFYFQYNVVFKIVMFGICIVFQGQEYSLNGKIILNHSLDIGRLKLYYIIFFRLLYLKMGKPIKG